MISVIVCSIDPSRLDAFSKSVKETIGADYELIVIDNRVTDRSTFTSYNIGVAQVKGDILCFSHEDILFRCKGWGQSVEKHFKENREMGMLGLCGAHAADKDRDWRLSPYMSMNFIQYFPAEDGMPDLHYHFRFGYRGEVLREAVAADGMWFCIRKELFDCISFDEATFNGFHQYDSDISFQVRRAGFKVFICFDILLEHFSPGNFNEAYIRDLKTFLRKWDSVLPVNAGLSDKQLNSKRMSHWAKPAIDKVELRKNFLRNYAKASPTLEAALKAISKSRKEGLIGRGRALKYSFNAIWSHLPGIYSYQRSLNR